MTKALLSTSSTPKECFENTKSLHNYCLEVNESTHCNAMLKWGSKSRMQLLDNFLFQPWVVADLPVWLKDWQGGQPARCGRLLPCAWAPAILRLYAEGPVCRRDC